MSTTNNFFRPKRHYRSVFREGKFLLNTEATEIQLEVLDRLREQVREAYGPSVSIKDGMLVEADTVVGRVIIRPGYSFIDGYPVQFTSPEDPMFSLGNAPDDFTAADFIKVAKTDTETGGIALQLGGASAIAAGDYQIVLEVKEELITAAQDPYLRSANLSESTADRHRLIVDVHLVEKYIDLTPANGTTLDTAPIPYRGSAVNNLVDYVEVTPSGANYTLISTLPLTGAEAIDGRNLEIQLNNGNGSTTAAMPVSNTDIREYIHGKLIDSNGTEFHISNMFVTPGNATRLTLQLDLEKTRPVQLTTFQSYPVITDSVPYRLVKRDLFITSAGSLPEGKRFYPLAELTWNGATVTNDDITDLRPYLLAKDGVLDLIRNQGLNLSSEGLLFWEAAEDNLQWESPIVIHSVFEGFDWTIAADDTDNLFGGLSVNEVLYVNLHEKPLGGSLTLKKGTRGVGDLTPDSLRGSDIFWIAKRLSDDKVYFNGRLVLNDLQTGYFHDLPPNHLLPQDILSLGYQAMFEEDMYDPSAFDDTTTTGAFFANSYMLSYSVRTITVSTNNITIPSAPAFTVVVGDVVRQGDVYSVITNVNTQQDFDVEDGSILASAANATISQVAQTLDLGDIDDGAGAAEKVSTYLTDTISKVLLTYDDNVIQITGNTPRIGYSISANGGTDWSDIYTRPESLSSVVNEVYPDVDGTDLRVRFISDVDSGDGTSILESFRAFFHAREFVGTLIPSLGSGGGAPGGLSGSALGGPNITNTQAFTLDANKVIAITATGPNYGSADDEDVAASSIGISTASAAPTEAIEMVTIGIALGVITGLGFSAGDEIYLGTNGDLVSAADVALFPSGYVAKQVGFAINSTDMWVQISDVELIP